jgi:hypothetical protein
VNGLKTLLCNYLTIASVIIAGVSAVVASLVAYLAYVRCPHITSVLGPKIMVYYRDFDSGGTFSLIAPVTFGNTAMKTGVVFSASLLVYREDAPQERYYMEWQQFGKLDGNADKWIYEEEAHALAVLGNSSVTKFACFNWFSKPKLVLREGMYNVTLCSWVQRGGQPRVECYRMPISSSQYGKLEELRAARSSVTVYVRLDAELQSNQLMTESESKKLLGLTR